MHRRLSVPDALAPGRSDRGTPTVSIEGSTLVSMSGRLKVTLTGGSEQYLDVSGNARELLLLIAAGNVGRQWLTLEDKSGVVRVDAIVAMTIEGTPEDAEHERDRLDARLMEIAGLPKMDDADVYGFERRGR
jgi:hypothetical protein